MKFNRFIYTLLFLSIFTAYPIFGAVEKSSSIDWLAFGDLRGHLEPCGCDPNSDLGSVQRLDAYIRRERMLHPNVALFHLGNDFTNQTNDLSKRKDNAIADSIKILAPTASLLNRQELLRIKMGLPELPYVLSNFKGKLPRQVKDQIVLGDRQIFGFVEPFAGVSELQSFSDAWLKKIKTAKSPGPRVLLYSGGLTVLKKIAASRVFDVIITSSTVPIAKEFGDEERRDEKKLIAYSDAQQEVLMVPTGGQGVIRSPSLQFVPLASTVSSLLEKPKDPQSASPLFPAAPTGNALMLSTRTFVKWLDPKEQTGMSSEILAVIDTYRNASSAAMDDLIAKRSADLPSSPFAGSEACQSCHAGSFKVWQSSKHAHAFDTIKAASRTSDPECVSCHVVGFNAKGGFVSETKSPHLANVQCESCHGPRKEHVQNPTIKVKLAMQAKDACATCHTPPHSPRFHMQEYWKKIEHK